MADELAGKTIAFLVANEGVEQVELTRPWDEVEQAGGHAVLVAPTTDPVQAFNHLDKSDRFSVDATTDTLEVEDYDGIVLPGGVANPDQLRTDEAAVRFVKSFFAAGKPAAVICHGPWTLVEADRRPGPNTRLLAQPADRYPQCGRVMGRRGGGGVHERSEHSGHEPKARRPRRVLLGAGAGVRRLRPLRVSVGTTAGHAQATLTQQGRPFRRGARRDGTALHAAGEHRGAAALLG